MAPLGQGRGIRLPGGPDCSWAWRKMSCNGSWALLVSASFCQGSASLRCKIYITLLQEPRSDAPGSSTQQRGGETCDAVFAVSFPSFSQKQGDVVCNTHQQTTCLTLWLDPELESKYGKCYWLCCVKKGAGWVFAREVSPALPAGKQRVCVQWVTPRLRLGCGLKERSLHKMKWFTTASYVLHIGARGAHGAESRNGSICSAIKDAELPLPTATTAWQSGNSQFQPLFPPQAELSCKAWSILKQSCFFNKEKKMWKCELFSYWKRRRLLVVSPGFLANRAVQNKCNFQERKLKSRAVKHSTAVFSPSLRQLLWGPKKKSLCAPVGFPRLRGHFSRQDLHISSSLSTCPARLPVRLCR